MVRMHFNVSILKFALRLQIYIKSLRKAGCCAVLMALYTLICQYEVKKYRGKAKNADCVCFFVRGFCITLHRIMKSDYYILKLNQDDWLFIWPYHTLDITK